MEHSGNELFKYIPFRIHQVCVGSSKGQMKMASRMDVNACTCSFTVITSSC